MQGLDDVTGGFAAKILMALGLPAAGGWRAEELRSPREGAR